MTYLEIAALAYLIFYYGILLVYRVYFLYRKTGINAVQNMQKKGLEGFIEKVFQVCFIMVSVIVLNFVFIKGNYQYFVPIDYLTVKVLGNLGIALSIIGLFVAFLGQNQMGDSWRLGLDRSTKTNLVEHGLFRYSRNPVYLGIIISNLGFFLMMPSAISFCFLVVSYIGFEVKIRLEENYLFQEYTDSYKIYFEKVRRWL